GLLHCNALTKKKKPGTAGLIINTESYIQLAGASTPGLVTTIAAPPLPIKLAACICISAVAAALALGSSIDAWPPAVKRASEFPPSVITGPATLSTAVTPNKRPRGSVPASGILPAPTACKGDAIPFGIT